MTTCPRRTHCLLATTLLFCAAFLEAQTAAAPPADAGLFPLDQIRAGQKATAWTVFRGTQPEPMEVEILGVLRGARGPGQDMILAQLRGSKPEYTGVVAGMSGSPVYIDGKLVGALAYRIGQFAKDPIAGITPIESMMAVKNLPIAAVDNAMTATQQTMQPMETPLVMSGFSPEAVGFWQKSMAGTGLETVAAGGSGSSLPTAAPGSTKVAPGAAVSLQLVRGDMEMAATCTVTYVDPKQLLACGHPVLQAGTLSLPMTEAEVVLTLASPLNSYKIVNTGRTIGAFTEDRDAAIRGVFGAQARMIPLRIQINGTLEPKQYSVEVADLPSLTPQAIQVVVLQTLLRSIRNSDSASYHVTGAIRLSDGTAAPVNLWAAPSESQQAPIAVVLQLGTEIQRIYANSGRVAAIAGVDLSVEPSEQREQLELIQARLTGSNVVHAGENIELELRLRPWQQAERNERIRLTLPARLEPGPARLVISDGSTLDRLLHPAVLGPMARTSSLASVLAEEGQKHAADRLYVGLLETESPLEIEGQTLSDLPLSVSNALGTERGSQNMALRGESIRILADHSFQRLFNGFMIVNLHVESGGGLN